MVLVFLSHVLLQVSCHKDILGKVILRFEVKAYLIMLICINFYFYLIEELAAFSPHVVLAVQVKKGSNG